MEENTSQRKTELFKSGKYPVSFKSNVMSNNASGGIDGKQKKLVPVDMNEINMDEGNTSVDQSQVCFVRPRQVNFLLTSEFFSQTIKKKQVIFHYVYR